MNTTPKSILLCEDNLSLASVLVDYLRANEFTVDHAISGTEAMEVLYTNNYDLCLLDISMPDKDGLSIMQDLRDSGKQLPVILLSERDNKEDIIAGYKAGCDDYVLKPFSVDVLICKIQALLRRAYADEDNQDTLFQLGDVTFDAVRQTLGTQKLSTKENDVLLMLCRKMNKVVERSLILKTLWQGDTYFSARSLAVYINHLRHIMSNVKGARIITVQGKGYKIVTEIEE